VCDEGTIKKKANVGVLYDMNRRISRFTFGTTYASPYCAQCQHNLFKTVVRMMLLIFPI